MNKLRAVSLHSFSLSLSLLQTAFADRLSLLCFLAYLRLDLQMCTVLISLSLSFSACVSHSKAQFSECLPQDFGYLKLYFFLFNVFYQYQRALDWIKTQLFNWLKLEIPLKFLAICPNSRMYFVVFEFVNVRVFLEQFQWFFGRNNFLLKFLKLHIFFCLEFQNFHQTGKIVLQLSKLSCARHHDLCSSSFNLIGLRDW